MIALAARGNSGFSESSTASVGTGPSAPPGIRASSSPIYAKDTPRSISSSRAEYLRECFAGTAAPVLAESPPYTMITRFFFSANSSAFRFVAKDANSKRPPAEIPPPLLITSFICRTDAPRRGAWRFRSWAVFQARFFRKLRQCVVRFLERRHLARLGPRFFQGGPRQIRLWHGPDSSVARLRFFSNSRQRRYASNDSRHFLLDAASFLALSYSAAAFGSGFGYGEFLPSRTHSVPAPVFCGRLRALPSPSALAFCQVLALEWDPAPMPRKPPLPRVLPGSPGPLSGRPRAGRPGRRGA